MSDADDPIAKRLRLTLGNGHGIAALIDHMAHDDERDREQDRDDGIEQPLAAATDGKDGDKRLARARWWREVIARAMGGNESPLLDHPAILTAVEAIEEANRQGEKVLVFGRFTRPRQALVDLLNARQLQRCLQQGQPWSQPKVPEDEWPAVLAQRIADEYTRAQGGFTRLMYGGTGADTR